MSEMRFKYGFPGPTEAQRARPANARPPPPVIDSYTGRELKPGDVYGPPPPPVEPWPPRIGGTDQHVFLGLARPGEVDFGYVEGVMQQKPFSEAEFFFKSQELDRNGTLGRTGWWPVIPRYHIRWHGFRKVIAL